MDINLKLTVEDLDFLNELLIVEVEKGLRRLENRVDLEENNVSKINAARDIQLKIAQATEEDLKKVGGSLNLGIEVNEDIDNILEEPVEEFEVDCVEALDTFFGEVDGEWIAEEIVNGGFTLNEYVDKLSNIVKEYFFDNGLYEELDELDIRVIKDMCLEYILQFDAVADLF